MDTYDFASKHLYRARRESAIDRLCRGAVSMRRVAYLDTGEALDTQAYLRRGYRPENLWAINRNPAEVAHLTMTLEAAGLPRVNTVGLDFEDALDRRVPTVDVIDFDGMSCIHDKLLSMLGRVSRSRPKAVYGVTVLAGRESNRSGIWRAAIKTVCRPRQFSHTSFGTPTTERHAERVSITLTFGLSGRPLPHATASEAEATAWTSMPCAVHHERVLWDTYVSTSGQPMLWMVSRAVPHSHLTEKSLRKLFRDANGMALPHCQSTFESAQDQRTAIAWMLRHRNGANDPFYASLHA